MKLCLKTLLLIVIFLVPETMSAANSQGINKAQLIEKFESYDMAINNGEGYSKATNEERTLAWAQSYLMEGYLDMYEATKQKKYLDTFVTQADRVCNNTDKARGLADYKGRLRLGWATITNKNKSRLVTTLSSGMILYPMLKFSLLVKKHPDKLTGYKETAKKYTQFAGDALTEFDSQWRFDSQKNEGHFQWDGDEPLGASVKLPKAFNDQLAIGRIIILLYDLTGNQEYLKRGEALANYFKRNLILDGEKYVWRYRPNLGEKSKIEDISHGAIDIDFALQAYKKGIIFNKQDMKRFANTFLFTCRNGRFTQFIDGTDDKKNLADYGNAVGRWLELSEFECGVYNAVYEYLPESLGSKKKVHPSSMLGIAKLIKYYDKCKKQN
jgi:hypothetical protein